MQSTSPLMNKYINFITINELKSLKYWERRTLKFIGRDGHYYSSSEDLEQANKDWERRTLKFILLIQYKF